MLSKEEYIKQYIYSEYIAKDINHLITKLNNDERVIFTKFGDGELRCMRNDNSVGIANFDGDRYTIELGQALQKAFIALSESPNTYIGRWHHLDVTSYCLSLYYDYLVENNKELKPPPYVHYHFCYNDCAFDENLNLFNFVKTLQDTKKHKIVITNKLNENHRTIFKADSFIEVPMNSWYAYGLYEHLITITSNILDQYPNAIILISAGLASKVLIAYLSQKYKQASFIDLGSGFDILSQNRYTRSERPEYHNTHANQRKYYAELLPPDYKTPF